MNLQGLAASSLSMFAALLLWVPPPVEIIVDVDGVSRTALVVAPPESKGVQPLILAFHGHGGSARSALRGFDFATHWPEAIAVYPHGLPTATPNDPKGERRGWDMTRSESNKDLKFVDALLAELKKKHKIDVKRIYAMGHSNGGGFTYTLWSTRGAEFAAFGPSAAAGARSIAPKPAFVVMGETDATVDPARQRASIETIKSLNGIKGEGTKSGSFVTLFTGKADLGTFVHPGGHKFPPESLKPMVEFFKRQQLP